MNSASWVFVILFISAAFVLSARYFFLARTRSSRLALTESREYRALAASTAGSATWRSPRPSMSTCG